jgi:hypothetical protein
MTHHGFINIPLSIAFLSNTWWLPPLEKLQPDLAIALQFIGIVVGLLQIYRLVKNDK